MQLYDIIDDIRTLAADNAYDAIDPETPDAEYDNLFDEAYGNELKSMLNQITEYFNL